MKKTLLVCATLAALLGFGPGARAALLNVPVPTNAYAQFGGLDWAWGGACPFGGCGSGGFGDLTYQSTQGWRLPTLVELLSLPSNFAASILTFPGANVPIATNVDPISGAIFQVGSPGADAACASPYFSSHSHCDFDNGNASNWAGLPSANSFADQLYVRDAEVPEPATLALLGAGLAGLGLARRRRRG